MIKTGPDAKFAAELIEFLARFALCGGQSCGLTGAQWTAMRYFSRATRTSRTVTAFADYHVTTIGTASQTVKGLVEEGLLQRTRLKTDGRIVQIDLTTEGRCICETKPLEKMVQAITELPEDQQSSLTTILESLIDSIATDRQQRRFGLCSTCHHISECTGVEDKETNYFCSFTREPLLFSDLNSICMDYKSGAQPQASSQIKLS